MIERSVREDVMSSQELEKRDDVKSALWKKRSKVKKVT